ncbi:MAG: high frequency lysogenization protein HflD [Methylococcales bacterium]|nr:high frequency lysogenization protein HflD [Methylococcales bacterium]
MQLKTLTNQTIALAGIAQAAALVHQLATTGKADNAALEASIGSVLKIDSDTVLDIYGGLHNLKLGLDQLSGQMTGYKIAEPQQARYCASLVFLENRLAKEPQMLNIIQTGIIKAQIQADQFGLLHENVLANLGGLYQETLSNLQPRIMVNGNPDYLSRPDIANKIRACLLAGIRSALLWRQCGGTRWTFLFSRKKMQTELEQLVKQVR